MQKVGRPHDPHFRIVAIHGSRARDAASLEVLGHYHPRQKTDDITVNAERMKHWLSKGAQPSATLRTLLKSRGMWSQVVSA
jgi:small subunit ribosomal protein S16